MCQELLPFKDGRNDSTFVCERRGGGREGKIGSALERLGPWCTGEDVGLGTSRENIL